MEKSVKKLFWHRIYFEGNFLDIHFLTKAKLLKMYFIIKILLKLWIIITCISKMDWKFISINKHDFGYLNLHLKHLVHDWHDKSWNYWFVNIPFPLDIGMCDNNHHIINCVQLNCNAFMKFNGFWLLLSENIFPTSFITFHNIWLFLISISTISTFNYQ